MTIKYTKEQLNKFDKDLLIELFLGMQGQMEELSRQTQALSSVIAALPFLSKEGYHC